MGDGFIFRGFPDLPLTRIAVVSGDYPRRMQGGHIFFQL
nr:MAG TPA: hypothetical protein [Siphoviridae sp. ctX8T1]